MRALRRTSFAVVVMFLAIACGKKEGPVEQTPAASAGVAGQVPQSNPVSSPAETATKSVAPAAGVIASTDGETEGIRIDVTEFKRVSGDTVNLKFNVVNGSSEQLSMNSLLDDRSMNEYYTAGGIHLVDPVNKRKYFVVRDADKNCVCSRDISSIDAGKKSALWAKFPAPPADVQRISIVFPKFIPLDDVPLP